MAAVELHQQNETLLEEKLESITYINDALRDKNRKLTKDNKNLKEEIDELTGI